MMSMVAVRLSRRLPAGRIAAPVCSSASLTALKNSLVESYAANQSKTACAVHRPHQLGEGVGVEQDDGLVHENDGGSRIGPGAGSSNSTPAIAAKRA
ncbi:hypothetical protein A8B73_12010 [Methylosinus sp. 3S-1]|nr:hypothetical protein A8B73_12010 [Methylosinus sp. 3S-1]